jgi:large subunit ribosomal protein L22
MAKTETQKDPRRVRAIARYVRVSPTKAGRILKAVRGKYTDEALALLQFLPQRAAHYVRKVVVSAVANAENNNGLDPRDLRIETALADPGPTVKRVRPRAQGRAYRILKRSSHITIVVTDVPKPGAQPRARRPRGARGGLVRRAE